MAKIQLGNNPFLYPHPVTLIGSQIEGKPNFMTIAFIGIVNMNPGMIALGGNRSHLTNQGILEQKSFSVNIPSQSMLEITDYVGLNSGKQLDKSDLFKVHYGKLKTAPMIAECPLNMECRLLQVLDLGGLDQIFIGEIVETYCEEACMSKKLPDIQKINPIVFSMFDNRYFGIGEYLGQGWEIGKKFQPVKR